VSTTSLNFTAQLVNTTSGEQTVTLTNSGSAPLTLGTLTLSGSNPGDFTAVTDPGTLALAPGESRTIRVRFRPTAPGSRSASLAINDNAAGSPQRLTLSGRGTMPSITFGISRLAGPGSMSFGSQPVGSASSPQTITLTNSGTAPLTISRITLDGADAGDFAIAADSGTGTLAPGATRTITLRFTPTTLGDRAASLTVRDDAAGGQQAVSLTGTGVMPSAANSGAGSIPTQVELVVAAVDGGLPQTSSGSSATGVTVAPGQHVTLKLLAKFANGAVADVTQDRNSQLGTSPAAGSFTGKNVWSAGPSDGGKTVTFYGRYLSPVGRKRLVGTATIAVSAARRSHHH
jgi:Abnormal spindle-like microcephaly-assoc'd, ASPM-SPD-2-Hydin